MARIGDELIELLSGARSEATIVAPFMKAPVVKRLMQNLAPGVVVSCITRWHPHEIKYGVSDLEVWDVLRAHQPSSLSLIPTLHAKFYRADDRYAIGSANLTNAALGWSAQPNVELLISGEVDQVLRDWESFLLSQATRVDESLVRFFERLVDHLPNDDFVLTEHYPGTESSLEEEYDTPNLEVHFLVANDAVSRTVVQSLPWAHRRIECGGAGISEIRPARIGSSQGAGRRRIRGIGGCYFVANAGCSPNRSIPCPAAFVRGSARLSRGVARISTTPGPEYRLANYDEVVSALPTSKNPCFSSQLFRSNF